MPPESCSVQLFSARPRKLRLCQGSQHQAPFPQRRGGFAPVCAQHTQTKWRWCRTALQRVMNNTYMSISALQEFTHSPASPPGRTLCHCLPACTPCCCVESLCPLGQVVFCRIKGIQHLTAPHEESSAPACAGEVRPRLSWGSPYSYAGRLRGRGAILHLHPMPCIHTISEGARGISFTGSWQLNILRLCCRAT